MCEFSSFFFKKMYIAFVKKYKILVRSDMSLFRSNLMQKLQDT